MEVDIELIKKLRSITGAGVLDCKLALQEANLDIDKAINILREKGKTQALAKTSRETKEGIIYSYIHHTGKIGVLLELNCETDFVARTDEFKNLAKEISLQIAATSPLWISPEDVPKEIIEREKEIYRKQAISLGKPEKVVEKIVENKLKNFFEQICLLEQPYIRDPQGKEKVKDLINSAISKLNENIKVKRFTRYQVGE